MMNETPLATARAAVTTMSRVDQDPERGLDVDAMSLLLSLAGLTGLSLIIREGSAAPNCSAGDLSLPRPHVAGTLWAPVLPGQGAKRLANKSGLIGPQEDSGRPAMNKSSNTRSDSRGQ